MDTSSAHTTAQALSTRRTQLQREHHLPPPQAFAARSHGRFEDFISETSAYVDALMNMDLRPGQRRWFA